MDTKEDGVKCMRGGDGKFCFRESERGGVWGDHVEKIMSDKNDWDLCVEADTVEGPVGIVCRGEVVQVLNGLKTKQALQP